MSSAVASIASSLAASSFTKENKTHAVIVNCGRVPPCNDKTGAGPGDQLKDRKPLEANIRASAEKILRSFNTWAFKREQPSDPQLMVQIIADAVARQAPIQFVL